MKNSSKDEAPKKHPLLFSSRFGLALAAFFGNVCNYSMRTNMSVAMVCMINHTATEPPLDGNATRAPRNQDIQDGPFAWSKETQGLIHGSFFWGYIVTQVAGGMLAEHVGGKIVYGSSMAVAAISVICMPTAAKASPYALMAARAAQGLVQGTMFPCMHAMWAQWAPQEERGKLMTVTSSGVPLGTVLAMSVSGLICASTIQWEGIFYVFGGMSLVWLIWWAFGAYNSPAVHPRVSDEERLYVEGCMHSTTQAARKSIKTPWKAILTSMPVIAIIVADTAACWLSYTLLTNTPTYLKEVHHFDIKLNGLYSAIPYMSLFAVRMIAAFIADALVVHKVLSVKNIRKLMFGIGMLGPCFLLIGLSFLGSDRTPIAMTLLALACGLSGFNVVGIFVNHLDIAPPFAGTLFGISNTFGTATGIAAPYVVAVLTREKTREQWQHVFFVAAAINFAGALFFALFADGEIQDWAKPYMSDSQDNMEKNGKAMTDMSESKEAIVSYDMNSNSKSTEYALDNMAFQNLNSIHEPYKRQIIDASRLTEL